MSLTGINLGEKFLNKEDKMSELSDSFLKQLREKYVEFKELDLQTKKGIFSAIFLVVRFVEDLHRSGTIEKLRKKSVAIELVNSLIDIPYVPEFVEDAIFSWLIDLTVEVLNKALGKLWVERVGG